MTTDTRTQNILEAQPERIKEALDRRSLVNWKYYELLFYLKRLKEEEPPKNPDIFADQGLPKKLDGLLEKDAVLKKRLEDFGSVGFVDLAVRAPWRQFKRKLGRISDKTANKGKAYLEKLSKNWADYCADIKDEKGLTFLFAAGVLGVWCFGKSLADTLVAFFSCIFFPALKLISQTLMLTIRTLFYGPLDYLAISSTDKLDKFFNGKKSLTEPRLKKRAWFIVFINILTAPVRLIGGLVEGIQEPLHFKKFWVKDLTFAWAQYKDEKIGRCTFAGKCLLWGIKVVFTLLAILTLGGGVTANALKGPSHWAHTIATPAHSMFGWLHKIFGPAYELPFKWVEAILVKFEGLILKVEGTEQPPNHFSKLSNAETAVEIGVEAAVSKFSDTLPENLNLEAAGNIVAEETSKPVALVTYCYDELNRAKESVGASISTAYAKLM